MKGFESSHANPSDISALGQAPSSLGTQEPLKIRKASRFLGGIEAGGTKFMCVIGLNPGEIHARTRFPTTLPKETLGRAVSFFKGQRKDLPLAAVGIAAFGPIDPDPLSQDFGSITSTPKPGWANTDLVGQIRRSLLIPVGFDTDVNAAALAEALWGAGKGLDTFVYLTVGTGIGGGGLVNGELMHGLVHPEMGHIHVPHDLHNDPYPGLCPFHGDCLEGLAAGPAIKDRWGVDPEDLPPDHPAWDLEAHYLALGLVNITLTLSPQRIILGGGVMQQHQLFPLIRQKVIEILHGYVKNPAIEKGIHNFIVPAELGSDAGVLGAIALASRALKSTPVRLT